MPEKKYDSLYDFQDDCLDQFERTQDKKEPTKPEWYIVAAVDTKKLTITKANPLVAVQSFGLKDILDSFKKDSKGCWAINIVFEVKNGSTPVPVKPNSKTGRKSAPKVVKEDADWVKLEAEPKPRKRVNKGALNVKKENLGLIEEVLYIPRSSEYC